MHGIGFEVEDDGFWQVHPGAPEVLVDTVLDFLAARPGESVLDLYAGVGLFARFLADAVGDPSGVTLVEGDPRACAHAEANVPGATVLHGDVGAVLEGLPVAPVDLVVLDPPREGARRTVVGGSRSQGTPRGRLRRLRPGRPGPGHRDLRASTATCSSGCAPSTCSP